MGQTEIYLDYNVIVDLLTGREAHAIASVAAKKASGCIFPYSPFHLEEVAIILLSELDEEEQRQHINRHLNVLRIVSELWEYVPGGPLPIQLIREEPIDSLNQRVLKDYWVTAECCNLEEYLDSQRSQQHFEKYSRKIGREPKWQIRSRETIRSELGIDLHGLSNADPTHVLSDHRVQQLIAQKVRNYELTVKDFPRGDAIRANHDLTRKTVDCLMRVLNEVGFYADKSGKHRSYMFDVGHTIYATRSSKFVVGDTRLAKRAQAIFSFLEAETQVVSPAIFFGRTESGAKDKAAQSKTVEATGDSAGF